MASQLSSPASPGSDSSPSPLFRAVKSGSFEEVLDQLNTSIFNAAALLNVDDLGRTILHYACLRSHSKGNRDAMEIAKLILWKAFESQNLTEDQRFEFVNKADGSNECAIHIALECENSELVKLLLYHGADVTVPYHGPGMGITYLSSLEMPTMLTKEDLGGRRLIRFIYKEMSEVFMDLLESHLKWKEDERDSAEKKRIVMWDFSAFTGTGTEQNESFDDVESQTVLLSGALHEKRVKRSEVLLHPLVQLFLYFKCEKFRYLRWFSIAYHIMWSLGSIIYFIQFGQLIKKSNDTQTQAQAAQYNSSRTFVENEKSFAEEWQNIFMTCFYSIPWNWMGLALYIFLFIITLSKELTEFIICPDKNYYLGQLENWGQWYLLFCVVTVVGISTVDFLGTYFGISGIFIAGLLTLGQLNKTELCGIYMEILVKVAKSILTFLGFFSPLIMIYALVFHLLMPSKEEFVLFGAIPKIVTMMTGEVEYDEVFHHEKSKEFVEHPALTKLTFLCFDLSVIIVLQNLLVGLTLSDIQELKARAKEHHLAKQLEQIYLLEGFMLSTPIKMLFKITGREEALMNLRVAPKGTEKLGELSESLQEMIKAALKENPQRFQESKIMVEVKEPQQQLPNWNRRNCDDELTNMPGTDATWV